VAQGVPCLNHLTEPSACERQDARAHESNRDGRQWKGRTQPRARNRKVQRYESEAGKRWLQERNPGREKPDKQSCDEKACCIGDQDAEMRKIHQRSTAENEIGVEDRPQDNPDRDPGPLNPIRGLRGAECPLHQFAHPPTEHREKESRREPECRCKGFEIQADNQGEGHPGQGRKDHTGECWLQNRFTGGEVGNENASEYKGECTHEDGNIWLREFVPDQGDERRDQYGAEENADEHPSPMESGADKGGSVTCGHHEALSEVSP
jgi:hypothetical protein